MTEQRSDEEIAAMNAAFKAAIHTPLSQLVALLSRKDTDPFLWFDSHTLTLFATVRHLPDKWGHLKSIARRAGINPFDLEKAVDATRHTNGTGPIGALDVIATDSSIPTATQWLWWPYLSIGHIAILDGEPGVGKSQCVLALAAVVSNGWPLPDQQGAMTFPTGAPGETLLCSAEDSLTATIIPRLISSGADRSKIHAVTGWRTPGTPPGEQEIFTFDQLPMLDAAIERIRPRLVIVDPIQAYMGSKVDINRSNETRPLLAALARIAEKYATAIILLRHPAKGGIGSAIHRGLGSIDFVGAARSAMFVVQHPTIADCALLCHYKNNLDILGRTQIFSKGGRGFHWSGITRLDAETLAGGKRGPDPYIFIEACLWLEQRLSGGIAVPANDLFIQGSEEGDYSKKVLHKAKKAIGVRSFQRGGEWHWILDHIDIIDSPSLSPTHSHTNIDHIYGSTGVSGITGVSDVPTASSEDSESDACKIPVSPDTSDIPVSPIGYRARSREEIEDGQAPEDGRSRAREGEHGLMPESTATDESSSALCPAGGRHTPLRMQGVLTCTRCNMVCLEGYGP